MRIFIPLLTMMLSIMVYTQPASAFDGPTQECSSCHSEVVADKVTANALDLFNITYVDRQTVSAVVSASNEQITSPGIAFALINADYTTGFKDEPGWRM